MQTLDQNAVHGLLSLLRQSRPAVFGLDQHGFLLNQPISEVDLSTFEHEYGVSLPSDYRHFISEIGDGGAGPFYGFFDRNSGIEKWTECSDIVGDLSEPFAPEGEWNDLSELPPDDLLQRDRDEYDRRMSAFDEAYWSSTLLNGAIPLCHEGCALRIYLVVAGGEAGHLWEDRRSEYEGLKPLRSKDGSSLTFSRWYQNWLRQCADAARLP